MSEPFLGEIRMVGFNFAPRGWAACDGQILPLNNYQALFSLFGTIYGGDGRTNFGLPDLRSRVPIHNGQGPGLANRQLGGRSGEENVTLNVNQMPSHSHSLVQPSLPTTTAIGNQTSPDGHRLATANDGESNYSDGKATGSMGLNPGSIANNGGSQSHNNMPPFLTINFVVALVGIYPSRS